MAEMKTYEGSCHCGKVRFEAKANLEHLMACNCSICSRTGALMFFVPEDQFTLKSGADALQDYQFRTKRAHHVFCTTCGVRSFSHGRGPNGVETYVVNARCLEGVDVDAIPVNKFDGKSL